jgi:hypothetical protein
MSLHFQTCVGEGICNDLPRYDNHSSGGCKKKNLLSCVCACVQGITH